MRHPKPRPLPISREIATSLVIASAPRKEGADATAGAIHALLVVLSRIATIVDDRGAMEELARDEAREEHDDEVLAKGGAATDTIHVAGRELMRDLGVTPAGLAAAWARIGRIRAFLAGRRRGMPIRPAQGDVIRGRAKPTMPVRIDRTLAFAAHAYGDPGGDAESAIVWWDTAAVARMRSRYAPVAYLRALAWIGWPEMLPEEDWNVRRTAAGALAMDIPIAEARDALGVDGYEHPSELDRQVVKAVRLDLARAGIRWDGRLVRNRRGEAQALRLLIAQDEAVIPDATKRPRVSRGRMSPEERARRRDAVRPRRLPPAPDGTPVPEPDSGFGRLVVALDGRREPRVPRPPRRRRPPGSTRPR
ncbi:hypothetical protein LNAOJCKE_4651 [Methylorubrum aminovorans]|uniref:Uncharacterized protein n=1 Tax=Methylorubrum aminovorans TaxID=269069 RepID=A0ABQ4UJF9_9HYPH|nr:hypothetical protein [Methylorubrum aminovorans]GJE67420.1 hypothetical protein LNAOJCKE_4651 [Methylorubrum aminovorans]